VSGNHHCSWWEDIPINPFFFFSHTVSQEATESLFMSARMGSHELSETFDTKNRLGFEAGCNFDLYKFILGRRRKQHENPFLHLKRKIRQNLLCMVSITWFY